MALFECSGVLGGTSLPWRIEYNDQGPGTVQITASGVGHGVVVLMQEDGRQAAVYFRDGVRPRLAIPVAEGQAPPDLAVERDYAVGSGVDEIRPARLNPFPPDPIKGGPGGFQVTQTAFQR